MHHGVPGPPPRLRRLVHHHNKDKAIDLPDPSPSSPDLPGSAGSLRRHVAAKLMQEHRSIKRNNHALQPLSPASYSSSLEVGLYNPAVTPTSSLDFKGRNGEIGYSLKTSTELLKVLNRIWSLEEQHTSNMSLVKALKKELDHAYTRIKELVRAQQSDRHKIEHLRNHIAEDKLDRKSKEQDRISTAIESVRNELENERKLRRRSEGLHRKLAGELSEVKKSFAGALKELERERNSRELLEDLCDEFARGIRDYEQEVHVLKQRSDNDRAHRTDRDRLILHISESWLDERMQMKVGDGRFGLRENYSVVDNLSSEIETFLQAKRAGNLRSKDNLLLRSPNVLRNSLESIPLNVVISAPQDVGDEEDSSGSDSHCFELNKPSSSRLKPSEDEPKEDHSCEAAKPNYMTKNLSPHKKVKGRNLTNLQVKFEEQIAGAILVNHSKTQAVDMELGKNEDCNMVGISISKKTTGICEGTGEERDNANGIHEPKANHVTNQLIMSQHLLSEAAGNMHSDSNNHGLASSSNSAWRGLVASPVRQWTPTLPSQGLEILESTSKLPTDIKESSLKAKLLEARRRGQRSRSRLKASKLSF